MILLLLKCTRSPKCECISGAYHFARPEQNDAISEAKYFVSILQSNQTDLMPVLDLESPTDPSNSNLTGNAISNWARSFINYVKQATGKDVMLYTGVWYINEFGISGLSDIPLWMLNTRVHRLLMLVDGQRGQRGSTQILDKFQA